MTALEYLKEAPQGTSKAVMQKIIQKYNGERAKINAAIKELWAKHEEDSSWVEVAPKQKKKPVRHTSTHKQKKPYGNNQRQKSQNWTSRPKSRPQQVALPPAPVQEEPKPPANSWASKLFKPEPEDPVVQPKPKVVEAKKEVPVKEPVPVDVNQVEAELFKQTEILEEEKSNVEEVKTIEPIVKPGVSFAATLRKPDVSDVTFGSAKAVSIDIKLLAEKEGMELLPRGTSAKIKQLELEVSRSREENKRLNARQNEIQAELSQSVEQNRKFSLRVQDLESAAKEKDNLRDEVSKLTKQLEEHQLQTRQIYDRMNDEPKKEEDKVKPPSQPPASTAPQQGYNMPQHQQHMYPAGMQYFPQYYSQFPTYPQSHGPPQSRYGYESQSNHTPPSHPPGPGAPSPPPDHHGHFTGHSHEEFSRLRSRMPQPPSREMGIEKNAQHAPPGYGNTQHQPYPYPPNVIYQQQQQFPPGQGQKWTGGR